VCSPGAFGERGRSEAGNRGKPNTRVTSRKVDPGFGHNLSPVVFRVPGVRSQFRFSRVAIRKEPICGVAIGQCRLNDGLWFAFRRFCEIDTCPTSLAAARYFAAGDTSVGFTPVRGCKPKPPKIPSTGVSGLQVKGINSPKTRFLAAPTGIHGQRDSRKKRVAPCRFWTKIASVV
jgi:hypothetical protein